MANAIVTLVVVFVPTLLAAALLGSLRFGRWLKSLRPQPVALSPPIEQIAADLRRLHRRRHELQDQQSRPGLALRTRALSAAYTDVLTTACQALDVIPPQVGLTGAIGSSEFARVESDLRARGLDVSPR
jgi:hypothetical protein